MTAGQMQQKKPTVTAPFIIKVFERHVETWSQGAGAIYARPRKAVFQHMLFRGKRYGLMETRWMITALYEVISPGKMDEKSRSVYRILKGMECILKREGLLRKGFEFRPNSFLNLLKAQIPELEISSDLAKSLNDSLEVMQAIRRLEPDSLEIVLHSIPKEYQPFVSGREIAMKAMAEYHRKPAAITWSITVSKLIGYGEAAKKRADAIMDLLNKIAVLLDRKVEEVSLSFSTSGSDEGETPEA